MLNISRTRIDKKIDRSRYRVFNRLDQLSTSNTMVKVLVAISVLGILSLWLPWTQNIRSRGYVTTLNPYDRPQDVQTMIDGRIEKWFVKEGDIVNVGDTLLSISESKEDYLDPQLLDRTQSQIDAKLSAANAYDQKVIFLEQERTALEENRDAKLVQNEIKVQQYELMIQTDSLELNAVNTKLSNALNQRNRTQELYDKGIKSLTDLEIKILAYQDAMAKVTEVQNKLLRSQNEIRNLSNERNAIQAEFLQKSAKIQADINATLSQKYETVGESNKLQSTYNKFVERSKAYAVTAPISGIITKTLKNGIGEFVKAGESISTIFPKNFEVAVEMYIPPRDMPLLKTGQRVRMQFDGWPALVFRGWPQTNFGTFGGRIFAIDNYISENGLYRILVTQDPEEEAWPSEVRVGGGADGLILLNQVRLYYELWRQLNGFPPDYYQNDKMAKSKSKAPIKRVK